VTRVYSLLQLPAAEGGGDALVRRFAELAVFELAAEHAGLRAAQLLRPGASGDPFLVLAEWDAPESYRAWLEHPARARVNDELARLLDGELRGGLYTAAASWPPTDPGEGSTS
jgi:heme-degrading monooxygenase HmoA